ncbi:hypothetical protein [Schleiferilactobacillus harbinensis]|uniref:Glycosyl-4,4'-diaponeurosporenoate acyltransferase n=1 Tax=Schleiferilactobacillus harbinensis TaxID=304207 RepID=A0A5P8M350_9LACO|nr:hypothetical protein [Schleiferilactobacillus harbinensis]QFR22909.1 hypothetical protein D1010_05330 [Schleiferilactobacillus harbinensis]
MTSTMLAILLTTFLTVMTLFFAWLAVRVRLQTLATIRRQILALKDKLRRPGDHFELSGPVVSHRFWKDYVLRDGRGILRRVGKIVTFVLLIHIAGIFLPLRLVMLVLFLPFADAVYFYIQLHRYDDLVANWDSQVQQHYIAADSSDNH